MNTVVGIAQGLLAVAMLGAGAMKLTESKQRLMASGNMDWSEDFSEPQIKGIGTFEVLAALGLILPALLDIAPELVGVAAIGVVLLMLGAAATHLRREGAGQPRHPPRSPSSSRSCASGRVVLGHTAGDLLNTRLRDRGTRSARPSMTIIASGTVLGAGGTQIIAIDKRYAIVNVVSLNLPLP